MVSTLASATLFGAPVDTAAHRWQHSMHAVSAMQHLNMHTAGPSESEDNDKELKIHAHAKATGDGKDRNDKNSDNVFGIGGGDSQMLSHPKHCQQRCAM